jgi:hypothetical protein
MEPLKTLRTAESAEKRPNVLFQNILTGLLLNFGAVQLDINRLVNERDVKRRTD